MNKEDWLPIKDFPIYFVSNLGRVKSIRNGREKIIKPVKTTGGYWIVCLRHPKVTRRVHRLVVDAFIGIPSDKMIDHIDGNRNNNNLSNLRLATCQENLRNKKPQTGSVSKFKGVFFSKPRNKWYSQIRINGRTTHIGMFDNELSAAKTYNKFAKKYYKQFAYLNPV